MKKCLFCVTFIFLITFSSSVVWGGVVELDNGSKIIGQIEKIAGGKVHVKTDFAGTLVIDMARVANLLSDVPSFVAFEGGNRLYGKINYDKGQTLIEMPEGDTVVMKVPIIASWMQGQLDPLAPPTRHWSNEIAFEIGGKSGNSKKFNTGGNIKAALAGPIDRLLFYFRWTVSEEDGVKSDDKWIGGIDYESDFAEQHSWYSRIELENDELKDLDLRTTAAIGYGYYFLKKPDKQLLRGRVGLRYRYESYSTQDSQSTVGPEFGIYHMYNFNKWWKLINDITYSPSFEDFGNYLVYHKSTLEAPLGTSDLWKIQMGLINDYTSQVAVGKDRLETTYFTRLVLSWD